MAANNIEQEYLIAGEQNNMHHNPGMLTFFMKDLYDKFNTTINNMKISIKYVQVLGDNIENIGFEIMNGNSTN